MNEDVTKPAGPTVGIPLVPIFIPGQTSKIRFEPAYAFRLFQHVWRGAVPDPTNPVRVMDWSEVQGASDDLKVRHISAESPMQAEASRLRGDFGVGANGDYVFDTVYPGDTFEVAFERVAAPADAEPVVAEKSKRSPKDA